MLGGYLIKRRIEKRRKHLPDRLAAQCESLNALHVRQYARGGASKLHSSDRGIIEPLSIMHARCVEKYARAEPVY